MTEATDVESYLHVGMVAYLSPHANTSEEARCTVVIRGWHKGGYIILDSPPEVDRVPHLSRGQICAIRFLYEGRACGFQASFLGRDGHGLAQMRVTWPSSVQSLSVRRYERIETTLPCELTLAKDCVLAGSLRDLSTSGCCIRCTHDDTLSHDGKAWVSASLPNGCTLAHTEVVIRNVRRNPPDVLVGCEFTDLEEATRQDIDFYVSSVLESRHATPNQRRCVLVLESDRKASVELVQTANGSGLKVLVARRLVDYFYRMRVAAPTALLVSATGTELAAAEVCRLIRGTHGFGELPIFVYGGDEQTLKAAVENAGATGYLPAIHSLTFLDAYTEAPDRHTSQG